MYVYCLQPWHIISCLLHLISALEARRATILWQYYFVNNRNCVYCLWACLVLCYVVLCLTTTTTFVLWKKDHTKHTDSETWLSSLDDLVHYFKPFRPPLTPIKCFANFKTFVRFHILVCYSLNVLTIFHVLSVRRCQLFGECCIPHRTSSYRVWDLKQDLHSRHRDYDYEVVNKVKRNKD